MGQHQRDQQRSKVDRSRKEDIDLGLAFRPRCSRSFSCEGHGPGYTRVIDQDRQLGYVGLGICIECLSIGHRGNVTLDDCDRAGSNGFGGCGGGFATSHIDGGTLLGVFHGQGATCPQGSAITRDDESRRKTYLGQRCRQ